MPATWPLVSRSSSTVETFCAAALAFAEPLAEGDLQLVAPLPDGVELLEAEADRVDQGVAAGASASSWCASPCGRDSSSAWLR